MGISRSASVVIAYAMKAFNMSLEEALSLVKKKRSCIKPNQAFCSQLKTYEGILDASRQRHNILWRSKSETNLKSATHVSRGVLRNHRNSNENDNVDSSNNNNNKDSIHKSTEELTNYDSSANYLSVHNSVTIDFPSSDHTRRPKSWSPDDHTAGLLFPQNMTDGGNDFGESWRLSQSLNVQSWRAHVTLQHRDLREISVEGSPVHYPESPVDCVEALNPLYADTSTVGTVNDVSSLQLSSSVKERINEFENVQTTVQPGSTKAHTWKKGDTIQLQNTISSTDDFDTVSSTAELDKVIENLLSPAEDLEGSEPVVSQTKPAAQKHQAVLVPSHIWQEEKSEVEENMDTVETPVSVPKDSITLRTGIVKKQKQDFEEKVKLSDSKHHSLKEGESSLSRQNSLGSLSGQVSKVEVIRSPSYIRQESLVLEGIKKDDPFSLKLDRVFDREERKQQRLSAANPQVEEIKETPSRNNSWGSFDSAVVLADREFPSRQSSWGSCDTRITVGTESSRNSSFGPFDVKQPLREASDEVLLKSNISELYFNKDTGPFSPGTIRRNKCRALEAKEDAVGEQKLETFEMECSEDVIKEDSPQAKSMANVKAYGPAPYKSPIERVAPMELSDEWVSENLDEILDHQQSTPILPVCIPDSTNPLILAKPQINASCMYAVQAQGSEMPISDMVLCRDDERNVKAVSPAEADTPIPGTVKQHKQLLEGKSSEGLIVELRKSREKLLSPTCVRSQSYCEPSVHDTETNVKSLLGCSFLEKKAKFEYPFEGEAESGKVKKLTQALEQQKNGEKLKLLRMRGVRKRSHSLERLSTSPTSPSLSSRNLLDDLLFQTQAEVRNLENETMEEICVKSLVGKFEDSKEKGSPKIQTRNVRAKSDSSTPDRVLPPVPQRKSSLDYNFKPTIRAQSQPPPTPVRNSAPVISLSPVDKALSSFRAPFHKPPPGGRGQICGVEVRQKKQQGKTHPLSKLTKTNRENYHTM
ncbi:hypothetical protein SK128_005469 [Halocaridina rubra]|uniref:Dual specificity phosphatase catalytic domain-containing protein n=1 Tax=Halocaridina rubra TaxID=373956 RepID=A0AAN9AEI0_HALRR